MPDFTEKCRDSLSEDPFPEAKSGQHDKIISGPQISLAESERGKEPAQQKEKTDEKFAQPGKSRVDRFEHVCSEAKHHACQKTAKNPAGDRSRVHRQRPRFPLGSS